MRIGIDMLGVQSPESRLRGIGRYALGLVSAMVRTDDRNAYVLYSHDGLPTDEFPRGGSVEVCHLQPRATSGLAMEERLLGNPDGIDVLLLLSPFELHRDYDPPARPLDRPAMAAVVHDLIPCVFQERYLTWPPFATRYYRNLERLRRYDVILTNSEYTRGDCLRILGMPPDRVVAALGAADPSKFRPVAEKDRAEADVLLARLDVDRPFVFCLGSMDERKNLTGLIDAFGLLPGPLRQRHQLVITFGITEEEARALREHARRRGVEDRMVLTGRLTDAEVRVLYARCAAFAHPSTYEGLGFPLLEAMLCGAPVLAGNNTSQVEVLGDAGLLANASDARDVAEHLARLLSDRRLAADLAARGRERALSFRWEDSAARSIAALERAGGATPRHRRLRADRPRPRLAVFSPWPPKRSGISTYASRLVDELSTKYAIDLYHEGGYVPDLGLASSRFGCYDARMFARNARAIGYRGVLYQMGNSVYHRHVFEAMRRVPGVVTLHDYQLVHFHDWYDRLVVPGTGHVLRELKKELGEGAEAVLRSVEAGLVDPGLRADVLSERQVALNREVFERASAVVLHSAAFCRRARTEHPDLADRVVHIPHGAEPVRVGPEARAATRARFGLPADALVLASFGILHPSKMNLETIEAFASLAREFPGAMLVFVGRDLSVAPIREHAETLGLGDRVRFLGHLPREEYVAMLGAVDIGISLRRPPTNGETSGALLDFLRHGIPTIVSETGTFADYPDDVVVKLRGGAPNLDSLRAAIRDLMGSAERREELGRAASRHVAQYHDWSQIAEQYAEVIEACAVDGLRARPFTRRFSPSINP